MATTAPPARPVVVLDACVLIPSGLRDLLLSCAHEGVFRAVWQDEILDEVRRNSVKLLVEKKGLEKEEATAAVEHTLGQMARAFPDAGANSTLWVPLVGEQTCDTKDRHVLAVAVGAEATHLVTSNIDDFPVRSRPATVAVVRPDRFMLDRLRAAPDLVIAAVEGMSARLKRPAMTPVELADMMASGENVPRFGVQLGKLLRA